MNGPESRGSDSRVPPAVTGFATAALALPAVPAVADTRELSWFALSGLAIVVAAATAWWLARRIRRPGIVLAVAGGALVAIAGWVLPQADISVSTVLLGLGLGVGVGIAGGGVQALRDPTRRGRGRRRDRRAGRGGRSRRHSRDRLGRAPLRRRRRAGLGIRTGHTSGAGNGVRAHGSRRSRRCSRSWRRSGWERTHIQRRGSARRWRTDPATSDEVAITFDDGPNDPYTLETSAHPRRTRRQGDVLRGREGGRRPARHRPALLEEDGHLLGNHSYHHDYWRWLDPRYPELERTQSALRRLPAPAQRSIERRTASTRRSWPASSTTTA